MNYAEMLKNYIKSSGLTLDEISYQLEKRNLSASKQYLSRLQNGKNPPASEELNRAIAEITNSESEPLIMAAFMEKAPPEVRALLIEGTKQREAANLLRKLNDYLDFYLSYGRINEDLLESIHEAASFLTGFDIDFHMLRKKPAESYRFIVIELTAYLLKSQPKINGESDLRRVDDTVNNFMKDIEKRSARYRAAMEGNLLLDDDLVMRESTIFGERLSSWRQKKKLSEEELAAKVNVTKEAICNYESGYSTPSNDTLVALANALDVDTDYLLGRTDKPRSMEMSLSFYGGGDDLTEDEIEEMEAALFRYRKTKERLQKQIEEHEKNKLS